MLSPPKARPLSSSVLLIISKSDSFSKSGSNLLIATTIGRTDFIFLSFELPKTFLFNVPRPSIVFVLFPNWRINSLL